MVSRYSFAQEFPIDRRYQIRLINFKSPMSLEASMLKGHDLPQLSKLVVINVRAEPGLPRA